MLLVWLLTDGRLWNEPELQRMQQHRRPESLQLPQRPTAQACESHTQPHLYGFIQHSDAPLNNKRTPGWHRNTQPECGGEKPNRGVKGSNKHETFQVRAAQSFVRVSLVCNKRKKKDSSFLQVYTLVFTDHNDIRDTLL